MSLFKKITLIMSLFLLVIFMSVIYLNFQSAKQYAQEEMSNNAQNTATYLSLSLANAQGDHAKMSTMINAIFDSGYFQSIRLYNTKNILIYEKTKASSIHEVPSWFLSLYNFQTPIAKATVSSGWNPIGNIEVIPLEDSAHNKLYTNFIEILQIFTIISLLSFSLLFFILRLILSSLDRLTQQAEAVSDNNFIINHTIPDTAEFKEVTLAMNKMVQKVKTIFEREANAVQEYHELLYKDPLTKLSNRNYLELKLHDLLSSEEADAQGVILSIYLDGIIEANKTLGNESVNKLIQDLATIASTLSVTKENTLSARLDGSKICIVFPKLSTQDIQDLSEQVLTQCIMSLEKAGIQDSETSIKIILSSYCDTDTSESIFKLIQDSLHEAKKNTVTDLSLSQESNYTLARSLIKNRIQEHSIALALQDVFNSDNHILHAEAYVRLFDENKNMHEAGSFIPLVHKMRLDTKLDQNVINCVLNESNLDSREVAINLSLRFLQDSESRQWLKERLAGVDSTKVLNFEISNQSLLSAINDGFEFSKMLRENGHNLGIDRFSVEEGTNLNYLQMLKPSYLKIDAVYLLDMLKGQEGQKNNALQIMIESLDIKIIATNIENKEIKENLSEIGVKYFQGSYLAKPKLV